MVRVKCEKCGKEYELNSGESPSDFQCECGGDLIGKTGVIKPVSKDKKQDKHRKTWSEQSTGIKALSIIIVIVFFLGIFAVISSLMGPGAANSYNGTQMTFQYQSEWKLSNGTSTGAKHVSIIKGNGGTGNEIGVDILTVSVEDEKSAMASEGYTYKGEKEVSGTKYYIYENTEGYDQYHHTVFLFQKNGKVIEITGHPSNTAVMEKIQSTIN